MNADGHRLPGACRGVEAFQIVQRDHALAGELEDDTVVLEPLPGPTFGVTGGHRSGLGGRLDRAHLRSAAQLVDDQRRNYKHPELTLGREPNEAETVFPRDNIELLGVLTDQIRTGHHFRAWDKIGYPGGILGRKDLTGVLVVPALLPPGLSPSQPTLTLPLTTSDELEVAVAFGVPRLSAMLGMQQRFFPTAIFVDRKRRSLCSAKDLAESLGAKAGHRLWLRDANVWNQGAVEKSSEARAPTRLPDAKATVHGTIQLFLPRLRSPCGRGGETGTIDSIAVSSAPGRKKVSLRTAAGAHAVAVLQEVRGRVMPTCRQRSSRGCPEATIANHWAKTGSAVIVSLFEAKAIRTPLEPSIEIHQCKTTLRCRARPSTAALLQPGTRRR